MSDYLVVLALLAAAFAVFFLVGRAMKKRQERWESDDWRQGGPTVKVGNALLEVQSLIEPGAKSMVEERRRVHKEEEDEGDPPTAGDSSS